MSRKVQVPRTERGVRAHELALQLMAQYGLSAWEFAFNTNVRRAGACHYPYRSKPGRIELSVHFVERNSEDEVRDTILHEIAHALVGPGHGHNEVWKAKCIEIGARPERCYDTSTINMPQGKWSATCSSCAKVYYRHRRPRQLTGWHCRSCGPQGGSLTWSVQGVPGARTPFFAYEYKADEIGRSERDT